MLALANQLPTKPDAIFNNWSRVPISGPELNSKLQTPKKYYKQYFVILISIPTLSTIKSINLIAILT